MRKAAMTGRALGDLPLSTLMLGTVQFGMEYGIANCTGQPSYETARDIIACAYEGGVTCLDTAASYGSSEEVLGRALSELGVAARMVIVTKVRPLEDPSLSAHSAAEKIEASVTDSLRALRLDVLPICLFHREEDFRYAEGLLRLKERGLVRHIGASVMTPEAASSIIGSGIAEAVQLPTSLIDQRYMRHGVFANPRKHGVALFIRSIYLQGLLLMPEHDIPPQLADVIPVRRKLAALAEQAGLTLTELAARYVLGLEGVTCAVVGVETVAQMRQNLALFARGPLDPALVQAIADAVPALSDRVLMPNRWFGAA
jgi:aryl-alcohol dehydrogenase-like predicted oxidoreductase